MQTENRFKAAREAAKKRDPRFTQEFVADKLGVTPQAISGWERGGRPDQDKLQALSRLYQVPVEWFLETNPTTDLSSEDVAAGLAEPPKGRSVRLVGYVGAGSRAHFYAISDEDFEEVHAPAEASDQTVAVEIRGKSFGPLMHSWLVFYDDVRSPVTPDLIGEVCVVGLADDRILIKKIQRNGRGGYDLLANTTADDTIENVQIEWAAKVTSMRPR